ncbi:MAG: anthranilate phosphoribosyltransferase [Deltaproteobacteria bacterium]|nr:anthranilate phosphoribosyltransferase [Deltaproteobacteria bacterium]MBW2394233.1 anthranilate phosphoribosyltransferase [Deltaproteobacteria bacterium]
MSLVGAIECALDGHEVPSELLEAAFGTIMDGDASEVQITALLIALRAKGETTGEIATLARVLRSRAETAALVDPRTVDTCGTGGDGADTFNVSTVAAFVVAGAGVPVAKHGNRAASSRTGSFDVLEALGVEADLPIEAAAEVLAEVGIGPFFARRAHPAMRFVAPVRQQLGLRTVMNCMGPLLNPVGARRQLVGVFARVWVERLANVLQELGSERALVVHGSDGLDEITVTGPSHAAWLESGTVRLMELDPAEIGIERAPAESLRGGDAGENATLARKILDGEPGPRRDIVVANAGAALWVAGAAEDWVAGAELARKSLDGGAAREKLEALIRATKGRGTA